VAIPQSIDLLKRTSVGWLCPKACPFGRGRESFGNGQLGGGASSSWRLSPTLPCPRQIFFSVGAMMATCFRVLPSARAAGTKGASSGRRSNGYTTAQATITLSAPSGPIRPDQSSIARLAQVGREPRSVVADAYLHSSTATRAKRSEVLAATYRVVVEP